jgi:hypothetical protein
MTINSIARRTYTKNTFSYISMDRSHRQKLRFEKLELRPGVCLIHAQGEGLEEANFGLDRKGDLLHQVSGRQPLLKFTPS